MGHRPGQKNPRSAVYRCSSCGREISVGEGERFPPCKCGLADWVLIKPA